MQAGRKPLEGNYRRFYKGDIMIYRIVKQSKWESAGYCIHELKPGYGIEAQRFGFLWVNLTINGSPYFTESLDKAKETLKNLEICGSAVSI